jgi:hypothetical protein
MSGSLLTLIVTVSKGIPRLKQFQAKTSLEKKKKMKLNNILERHAEFFRAGMKAL